MNRIYRTVWNAARGQWQVAPENVKRHSKSSACRSHTMGTMASLAVGSILLLPLGALASGLPSGGEIRAGSGDVEQSGSEMRINQDSDRMAIDWDDFSVDEGSRVAFNQPGRDAAALNRVTGDQLSQIRGAIEANGQVFLVNPNGIVFGDTAQVDVGGLVASTLDISPDDFMAGDFTFEGDSSSAIINQGNIRAGDEGYVALIAAEIINEGNIKAPRGDVMMGAGSRVTLDMGGPIKIEVEEALLDTYIEQGGAIQADGGRVYLTAKAAGDLAASVINHTGTTQARTLAENEQGEIWLMGDMDNGETQVAGTLDASAPDGGDGGFVETSAAKVSIVDEATVTTRADEGQTGEWLIDPYDFTIAESGGDLTGTALSTALGNSDVTIETTDSSASCTGVTGCGGGDDSGNGDIFVDDTVTWDTNTLTLSAYRNIEINREMTATSGGGLALAYGQGATDGIIDGTEATYAVNAPVNLPADGSFSTKLGSNGATVDYTIITELGDEGSNTGDDLQGMQGDRNGDYVLGADIDASDTENWDGGAGFEPVSEGNIAPFTGTFNGLGHVITGLSIDRASTDYVGLFGYVNDGTVRHVGLEGGSVTGNRRVGGLVGYNDGTIKNAYATGDVNGADSSVGGLVGYNDGTIKNAYATGDVNGDGYVGGLVGYSSQGAIETAYATGDVTGADTGVGGLVGYSSQGAIENAYATGDVTGNGNVGGLVGYSGGTLETAYATGEVTGDSYNVGGLVGYSGDTLENAYATGDVTGDSNVGGLVGYNNATITAGFWDTDTTGQTDGIGADNNDQSGNVTGLTTSKALTESEYGGLDFDNDWFMVDGDTRPFLRSEWSSTIRNAHQLQLMAMDLDADYKLAADIDLASALSNKAGMWATDASDADNIDGAGFAPIGEGSPTGDGDTEFTGTFDGRGHTVSDLTIDRPDTDYVGMFGFVEGGTVRHVGLEGGSVRGGDSYVGGLVGISDEGTIENSYATGDVDGSSEVGGLVGYNSGTIENAYATGDVVGDDQVGGLVGMNYEGTIRRAYATGPVDGDKWVGGLVGTNQDNISVISNVYATGEVAGSSIVGGLVGGNFLGATIKNGYAAGAVAGSEDAGGLVGNNGGGELSASFWDTDTTGQSDGIGDDDNDQSDNVTGLTTAVMKDPFNFIDGGWDYAGTWGKSASGNNDGYMVLKPLDDTAYDHYVHLSDTDTSKTYGASDRTLNTVTLDGPGSDNVTLEFNNTKDTGTYAYDESDVLDLQLNSGSESDYYFEYGGGELTIDPRPLDVDGSRTYDGTNDVAADDLTLGNLAAGESLTLSGTGTADSKNAGKRNVDTSGLTLGDDTGETGNYTLSGGTHTVTIDPSSLTVTANDDNKTYGEDDPTLTWQVSDGSLVGDDTLTVDLTRETGEDVGNYDISATDLANGNYAITAQDGTFTIDPRAITVAADDRNKTYGEDDPTLTWQVSDGNLVGDDTLTGDLTREDGEDVGNYAISAADLSNGNYAITAQDGTLTIDPRAITVAADDRNKTYGEDDPTLTWQVSDGNLVGDDTLTGDLTREDGEDVGNYTISAADLANGNYTITAQDGTFTIDPRAITVAADDRNKTYGEDDPTLTWQVSDGNLVGDDTLTGDLTREAGEDVGNYDISAADLSNGNYVVTAQDGVLTIDPRAITVNADDQRKIYGMGDPELTWQVTEGNLIGDDTLSGDVTRATGESAGNYTISPTDLANSNYIVTSQNGTLTIDQGTNIDAAVNQALKYASPTDEEDRLRRANGLPQGLSPSMPPAGIEIVAGGINTSIDNE
ncbi:MBG domain-containing protein [Halomonas sp. hl-4]|uniref:MBG domain-containing protein n=1 Tax=Halomonas sp. hl-4 TaxID=1761789 RepID=UPI000BB6C62A|nr:MBG domain-containing protein [Halomonas sp. hl-4]SNY97263.1 filamentous hemagglutinin family N-terminal domain-containing protein [Halomonas sp. hl-4]